MKANKSEIYEDKWVGTMCGRCYGECAVRVHVINGVAVKIEGEPDSTRGGAGGLCAKGAAGLQVLYDPNRLNVPLRRTNPEKGLHVDPKWKEISWEEAIEEMVPRLKKIMDENPRKLLIGTSALRAQHTAFGESQFMLAFGGTQMTKGGGGLHCGSGAHPVAGMVHASWDIAPDYKYCNYTIFFGSSQGVGSGHTPMAEARLYAEARARGMKSVSFDPMCNFCAGKATEWVPIIPGTDGAVILAMCNVIVNELGIRDETYLKTKSNAPYLIGPDGRYVREKGPARGIERLEAPIRIGSSEPRKVLYIGDDDSNKPLVWDAGDNKAKVYDDPSISDYALEGSYEVRGIKCQPAFQLVREHLKEYTLEMASKVSTVPAETIHRIATEFANAASVGSTITIDGHELPLRPASAVLFRGGQGHENSRHTCFAVALLNQIVGSAEVPGGTLGLGPSRSLGYPGTGYVSWSPYKGVDGFLESDHFGSTGGVPFKKHHFPFPVAMPKNTLGIIPLGPNSIPGIPMGIFTSDQEEIWQQLGRPDRLETEMMLSWGVNAVLGVSSPAIAAEVLGKIPFIVVYDLFNNETTEGFADIVLPATSYLEESIGEGLIDQDFNQATGMEDWSLHIIQPAVEPKHSRRQWGTVLIELAERLGIKEKYIHELNTNYGLDGDYALKPTDNFSPEELLNRIVKKLFGDEHDWEWFKKHGFMRWPKKAEEAYWRYFLDVRAPIYLEYHVDQGEKTKEIAKEIGFETDCTQFTPLISWFPCSIHLEKDPQYDLYCFSYRDTLHTGSITMEQPWLDEASRMNPYTYNITMNVDTAKKKGLKDGDIIEIATRYGRKVEGTLKLTEGQHLQTMGIAATAGHWAKGQPIARGKGTNFDTLLEFDRKHVDPVSGNIETCVRVKVRKVGKD